MSHLFVGSTILFGLYSYYYKDQEVNDTKKRINADVINIDKQTITSFYDESGKCVGCKAVDGYNKIIAKSGINDYNYKHKIMCRMAFLDDDIPFAKIIYDTVTGDIKQFHMDNIHDSQIICGIIINCLYLNSDCNQLSILDDCTEMSKYIKKHGNTKSYGYGIEYNVLHL